MAKGMSIKIAWGSWKLGVDTMKLAFIPDGETIYEVPIDEFCDSAGILNCIFEVNRKPLSTAKVMRDLLNSIDDVFFPVSICINRENNKIDPKNIVDEYLKNGPNKLDRMYEMLNSKDN